jgi:hypothetical protein
MFSHPHKRELRNQKIPAELLGRWQLVVLGKVLPICPITMEFQSQGKIKTTFPHDYAEGWYWVRPDGLLKLHNGFHHKVYYAGYENCNIDPSILSMHLDIPDFVYRIKNDTLRLRIDKFETLFVKK